MYLAFLAQAGQSASGGGFLGFLPFILILVIIYFLMLRPQMKKQKEQAAMIASISKNDEVVTSGGLHGKVIRVNEKDTTLQIMIARGVIVTIERSSVGRKKEGKSQSHTKQIKGKEPEIDNEVTASDSKQSTTESHRESKGQGVVTVNTEGSEKPKPKPRRRPRRAPHKPRPGPKTEASAKTPDK